MKSLFFCLLLFFSTNLIHSKENEMTEKGDYYMEKSGKAMPTFLGKVVFIKGDVIREAAGTGQREKLKLKGRIQKGDKIYTGDGAFVKVLLSDDSVFSFGENSSFHFNNFNYESKENRSGFFNFLRGKLRAVFPVKLPEGKKIMIDSKHVAMGIRGTEILANSYYSAAKNHLTHVAVLEGNLDIQNKTEKEKFSLGRGEQYIYSFAEDSLERGFQKNKISPALFNKLLPGPTSSEVNFLPIYRGSFSKKKANRSRVPTSLPRQKRINEPEGDPSLDQKLEKFNRRLKKYYHEG